MATQGKKHMGGRKRYVTNMLNIPASRENIKEKFPTVAKKPASKFSTIGDQPTRRMLGIKIKKGGK